MSAEGMECNGGRQTIVTYKRKRAGAGAGLGPSAAPAPPQENTGEADTKVGINTGEADTKVFNRQSCKGKVRDIGWEHGVIVHGNRFHWQCNWCGLVRYGGGVSRLKRHIAGTSDTVKCPKVPEDVSIAMRNYLIEKELQRQKRIRLIEQEKKRQRMNDLLEKEKLREKRLALRDVIEGRNFEHSHLDDSVDKYDGWIGLEMQARIATQHPRRVTKRSRTATRKLKFKFRRSESATLQSRNGMDEDDTRTSEEDGLPTKDYHWRNVLKHMLQLPDGDGGGIMSCIRDALTSRPFGRSRNLKMTDDLKGTTHPKDRYKEHFMEHDESQRLDASADAKSDELENGTDSHADTHVNTMKCQNVFLDILLSEKFVLLCDLLCQSFLHVKYKSMLDFNLINSKMKSGEYEESPALFGQDIQQVWDKLQKIGEEIGYLSSGLSHISRAFFQKQVGEGLVHENGGQKSEGNGCLAREQINSVDSNTTSKFPCVSEHIAGPDQTKPHKVSACKQCGLETDGNCSLICDGCNSFYHYSCTDPPAPKIPSQSWYCCECLPEPVLTDGQHDRLHQNCLVCDRLEVPEAQTQLEKGRETLVTNDSRESSISNMESDEPPEPSGSALPQLCKQCGSCEDEDKRFLICGNAHCLYKYYHIRCLRSSQIASYQQQSQPCWFCPSCLCRACLSDKDDEKIVMCDGCDEAYHTYCMKPPRTSIPEGKWYCVQCNMARAKKGMRRFERRILKQHTKKNMSQARDVKMSVDLLLKAAEKLSSEERLVSSGKKLCD